MTTYRYYKDVADFPKAFPWRIARDISIGGVFFETQTVEIFRTKRERNAYWKQNYEVAKCNSTA